MNEIFHGLIDFSTLIFILDVIDFFPYSNIATTATTSTHNKQKALYIQLCVQVRVKKAQ